MSNDELSLSQADNLEAMNEAFVLQGSLAVLNLGTCSDDLLATLNTFTSQHVFQDTDLGNSADMFKWRFLSEVYRLLGLQYDYSVNANYETLVRNTLIQRCLSLQASLGFHGTRNVPPTLPSQVAQTILDLRFVAYAIMMTESMKPTSEGELD